MIETIGDFETDGYSIIKNIVPKSRINSLLESIFKLYCKFSKENDENFLNLNEPWITDLFHSKLIEFRKSDPESFGAIYDSLKTNLALTQLVTDDIIVNNVAKNLKSESSDLSISEPMCRIDVPDDSRNVLGWHQERSFFPQNRDGLNGLVCWIPLTDVTDEMGSIHISPESHKEGFVNKTRERKENSSYTTQIPVPQELVEKYKDQNVPVKAGDVIFFNMLLFHRSGKNISNKVRFAIQGRFHKATANDFAPFDLINYYNPFIKQKLEKNHDCSDIPNNTRQPPVA